MMYSRTILQNQLLDVKHTVTYRIIVKVQRVDSIRLDPVGGPGSVLVRSMDSTRDDELAAVGLRVSRVGEEFGHGGDRGGLYPHSEIKHCFRQCAVAETMLHEI